MKNKFKAIIIVLVLFVMLCGCLPTPDESVVIPKENTEQMVYEASKESADEQFEYKVPEHVTDRFSIKGGNLDIVIDADVYMPDVTKIPVSKVVYDPFTVDLAEQLKDYFVKDGMLVSQKVMTKSDYDRLIIENKKGHMENGEYVFTQMDQDYIDQLIEQREKAPDEDVQTPITQISFSEEEELRSRIKADDKITGGFFVKGDRFIFFNHERGIRSAERKYYDIDDNPIEAPSKEIDMTKQQAIEWAQQVLDDLKIDYMSPVTAEKVYYTQPGDRFGDILCGGYTMEFIRELGGIASANIKPSGFSDHDKYEVMPPISSEKIRITIDEYGVVTEFWWENPARQIEILTEHVDILPFNEIMLRFKEFAQIQCAFEASCFCSFLPVKKVYDIRLNLIYMPIKNNPNEFMLTPCWCFTYKDSIEYTLEDLDYLEQIGMEPIQEERMGDDYFIFSAVDGASISPYSYKFYQEVTNMGQGE